MSISPATADWLVNLAAVAFIGWIILMSLLRR